MQIKNLRKETKDGLSRVVATVVWEDVNGVSRDIYFETIDEFKDDLAINPDAFLVGSCLPAMYAGEKRIKIEGEICPILQKGIITNMQTFRRWYGWRYKPVAIEAKKKEIKAYSSQNKRAGLFLSGGVDSTFSLRTNRLSFPLNHPLSIKDCFLIHGFDISYDSHSKMKTNIFDRAFKNALEIAQDAKVNLIPVTTNVRHLNSDVKFWEKWFHGAALSSVAHCFSSRISMIYIASSHSALNLEPWGSHPYLDPNYSSTDLKIIHDKLCARIDKIKIIADWDIALQKLRVCTQNHDELLNCGKCVMCIKTMVMLLTIGKLKNAEAFSVHDVTPQELEMAFRHQNQNDFKVNYLALVEQLKARGRYDLAQAILKGAGLKGMVRRFDEQYFGKNLTKVYSFFANLIAQIN